MFILGVDHLDQHMSYYHFIQKAIKWWRKVIEVASVNAYIIYTKYTNVQHMPTHKGFHREIVMSLREEQHQTRSCSATCQDETVEWLKGSHFPESAPLRRMELVMNLRPHAYDTNTLIDEPHRSAGVK